MSATVCINDGDTHNAPVEETEARLPLRVQAYALRPDSGGAGIWRGGLGAVRVVETLGQAWVNAPVERTRCAPWGLSGGGDGLPNRLRVIRADGSEQRFPDGKLDSFPLQPGDAVWIEAGGGGGFGDPLERPAGEVAGDLRQGYVSVESAERDYGLRLDPATGEAVPVGERARRAGDAG